MSKITRKDKRGITWTASISKQNFPWLNIKVTGDDPKRGTCAVRTRSGKPLNIKRGNRSMSLSWNVEERRFASSKEFARCPAFALNLAKELIGA